MAGKVKWEHPILVEIFSLGRTKETRGVMLQLLMVV